MKKLIFSLLTAGILVFSGCEKELTPIKDPIVNLLEDKPTTDPIFDLMLDEDPQSLSDSLETVIFGNPVLVSEFSPETPDINASILDYPPFLDFDPFTNVTVRSGADSCLKGIEITKAEKELLNKTFIAKLECQKANKETIARIHRDIESWAKTQKQNYYKNWYLVEREKLSDSLRLKLITESQYKEKIAVLEKAWSSKMSYLNGQVKEKIKNSLERAEACGKIKDCEKIYLSKVLEILGKTRYKKWIECYKYNYRKK